MGLTIRLIFFVHFLISSQVLAAESALCQPNAPNQLSFSNLVELRPSGEFTVMTWNAYKLSRKNYLKDLTSLSQDLDLILIQEAMHSEDWQNLFVAGLNFSFSFYKSFCNSKKQATGVMSASRYLLGNNLNLVSPVNEPITSTPKVSGYSLIEVPEIGLIHVINTHALNFNLGGDFKKQIDKLVQFISQLQGPVIWAGDFNTWSSDRTSYLNKKAKALGLTHLIPTTEPRNMQLDHIYVRGLNLVSIEVLDTIDSSDHWPVKAVFRRSQTNLLTDAAGVFVH